MLQVALLLQLGLRVDVLLAQKDNLKHPVTRLGRGWTASQVPIDHMWIAGEALFPHRTRLFLTSIPWCRAPVRLTPKPFLLSFAPDRPAPLTVDGLLE